ncbi:hypothetical protein Micbo1qcDRAFT_169438 [Microdochium bolleyi]|uniref:Uncharacterized protein n=1 Tax=Microdochium bolleyi TaxID=196109 RepID=A0A136IKH3_9PEZI|nr:hypothetical protein Micbo1qcDRAFT_169438 [Microdochium bolleyi]
MYGRALCNAHNLFLPSWVPNWNHLEEPWPRRLAGSATGWHADAGLPRAAELCASKDGHSLDLWALDAGTITSAQTFRLGICTALIPPFAAYLHGAPVESDSPTSLPPGRAIDTTRGKNVLRVLLHDMRLHVDSVTTEDSAVDPSSAYGRPHRDEAKSFFAFAFCALYAILRVQRNFDLANGGTDDTVASTRLGYPSRAEMRLHFANDDDGLGWTAEELHWLDNGGSRKGVGPQEEHNINMIMTRMEISMVEYQLITTDNGLIGWAPGAAAPGDRICIVPGCSVPVLFRELQDGSGRHLHLGPCFVPGLMDGEAARDRDVGLVEAAMERIRLG